MYKIINIHTAPNLNEFFCKRNTIQSNYDLRCSDTDMDAGTGGAGGAAAPVALYREGQGGQRCPFNLKDCLGKIANCQKC
jgi:hypothetical protein